MKFVFYTLGCKVNQFETQALEQLALERGHRIVQANGDAVILNTCTVTSISDHKNIRAIHKLRRDNPNAILAVCGCLSQVNPDKIRSTGEVNLISGTENRKDLIYQCEQAFIGKKTNSSLSHTNEFEILPAGILAGRTRGLLKIEDGCDNFCSYCIIPYARGRVRSLPMEIACAQAKKMQISDVKEIILTGIEISSYGKDLGENFSLLSLISNICSVVPTVRIRLGSLEPRILTESFCKQLSEFPNLARHFHLSLQSGCDRTLRDMNRKYTTKEFAESLARLRKYFPDASITGDLITGFPGETDEDFVQTLAFIQDCQFSALHVFPYSEREGTHAAKRTDSIPIPVRQARAEQAKSIAAHMTQNFLQQFLGRTIPVLLESPQKNYTPAHSNWHFSVRIPSTDLPRNTVCMVKITQIAGDYLLGNKV
jgi:threonylcarbamoyladenosine tRNA methylthiotransferase MtaB